MSFGPPPPPDERRGQFTPALAVRVAVAGSVVLALFAIVFFRLWFLQVLSGHQYVLTASHNQTRVVALAPERGEILASDGQPLVTSTTALAVQIDPTELPVRVNQTNLLNRYAADDAVYDRLARVIGAGVKPHHCVVPVPPPSCQVSTGKCPSTTTRRLSPIACDVAQSIATNTYADVTIRQPVSTRVQFYIAERANLYRGVDVEQTSVPGYPYGGLAAQTLGYVGRLTSAEHAQKAFRHVNENAVIGQTGLESEYDQYLRGTFGKQRVRIDAQGIAVGEGREQKPTSGDNLRTTLDLPVQQVGDSALARSTSAAGSGGAYVAIDPDTGAIKAMGSDPTYDPSVFTHPQTQAAYAREFGASSGYPQLNRAYQSVAPDGSTFKVITSVAALQSGAWTPDKTYDDTGQFCEGTLCRRNAEGVVGGVIDMESALKISDDDFYYNLGALTNVNTPRGGALQRWADAFGVGRNPHVDLPGAADGRIPTPGWFDRQGRLEEECDSATGAFRYTDGTNVSAKPKRGYHRSPKHSPGGCGYGTPGQEWTIGDNVNAAVGQGYDQISPLQLALVYSALENGGTIVRPHIGQDIENAEGTVLQKLSFAPQRHLDINPTYLDTIRTGLNEAAQGGGADPSAGTSQTVFQNFGLPVYGKTGTAQNFENGIEADTAWYASWVPGGRGKGPLVVVVWVENGGYGAISAAPVARQVLSQYYYGTPGPYVGGNIADQ